MDLRGLRVLGAKGVRGFGFVWAFFFMHRAGLCTDAAVNSEAQSFH